MEKLFYEHQEIKKITRWNWNGTVNVEYYNSLFITKTIPVTEIVIIRDGRMYKMTEPVRKYK